MAESSDLNNTELTQLPGDSETDGDEEKGVTLVEVLEEEAQLQEDADAVLGGSDDANCTYSLVNCLTNNETQKHNSNVFI